MLEIVSSQLITAPKTPFSTGFSTEICGNLRPLNPAVALMYHCFTFGTMILELDKLKLDIDQIAAIRKLERHKIKVHLKSGQNFTFEGQEAELIWDLFENERKSASIGKA